MSGLWTILIGTLPQAAVLGWVGGQSSDPEARQQMILGCAFAAAWTVSLFRIGWSANVEMMNGTYELARLSDAPLALNMFAKALSVALLGLLGGVLSAVVATIAAGGASAPAGLWWLIPGAPLYLLALAASTLVFAPFMVLARGRGGFFNAIIPLGAVLGGFYYPVSELPTVLRSVAKVFPLAWAVRVGMDGLAGSPSLVAQLFATTAAVALTLAWLAVAWHLFRRVERRLYESGG